MSLELTDATVLITSKDPDSTDFGSGFVILRTGETAYIVTCAYVIRKIGADNILVNKEESEVVITGDSKDLDLAVIKAEVFPGNAILSSRLTGFPESGQKIDSSGFKAIDDERKSFLKQDLEGVLVGPTQVIANAPYKPARSWKFSLLKGDIEDGYIGSPIVEPETNAVLGIISQRTDEGEGIAISIEQLDRIWQPIAKNKLRKILMGLGFESQEDEFFEIFEKKKKTSAYLIHGPTDKYGQRWLLNRLIQHFLPVESISAKKFRVDLGRVGRRNDISAMWGELADELQCNREASPKEIAQRTARWWLKNPVIIAIYDVNCLTEQALNLLIQEFWLPLVKEIEEIQTTGCLHRLLMFLVDNEGITAAHTIPLLEKIGISATSSTKLDSSSLKEFSKRELRTWVRQKYPDLPEALRADVEPLLNASDGGIPEWAFEEICRQFGYHWKAETQSWYVL